MFLICNVIMIMLFSFIFCADSIAEQNITTNPQTYEEAYNSVYGLIQENPEKALQAIKYIYNKNLPVKQSDVFYVNSIASMALRPIFRENEIGKKLLEKVVAVKNNDFTSNRILMAFAAMNNDSEGTRKYALNLLNADYNSYIQGMAPAASSSLPEIRNYLDGIINTYQIIAKFFMDNGDQINSKKATKIVNDIIANK